jgi:hypothetical protein
VLSLDGIANGNVPCTHPPSVHPAPVGVPAVGAVGSLMVKNADQTAAVVSGRE